MTKLTAQAMPDGRIRVELSTRNGDRVAVAIDPEEARAYAAVLSVLADEIERKDRK